MKSKCHGKTYTAQIMQIQEATNQQKEKYKRNVEETRVVKAGEIEADCKL